MLGRVTGTLIRYRMLAPGDRIGVAVSGGADSVCLLHVLHELKLAGSLSVVHVNHDLRGAESDDDEQFVRQLAASLGLRFHCRRVSLAALDSNLEQAGRKARSRYFSDLISTGQLDRIATGHTRSDQAETILYRLMRGSGTAGLAGIWPVAGPIVRPLLEVGREDVLLHLRSRGLSWREDSSNESARFARNRIRHDLLPELQKFNPALEEVLAGTAAIARDEEIFWSEHIGRLQLALFRKKAQAVLVPADKLLAGSRAEARRLLRVAVESAKGDLRQIDFQHIEQLLLLAEQQEGHGRLQLPGLDVFRSFNWLRFAKPRIGSRESHDYSTQVALMQKVELPREGGAICLDFLEEAPHEGEDGQTESTEGAYTKGEYWLEAEFAARPLTVRNWHPGDALELESGLERVKTLFQRDRIPIWERQAWPILECDGRIIWARQFGASANAKARPGFPAVRLTDTPF